VAFGREKGSLSFPPPPVPVREEQEYRLNTFIERHAGCFPGASGDGLRVCWGGGYRPGPLLRRRAPPRGSKIANSWEPASSLFGRRRLHPLPLPGLVKKGPGPEPPGTPAPPPPEVPAASSSWRTTRSTPSPSSPSSPASAAASTAPSRSPPPCARTP